MVGKEESAGNDVTLELEDTMDIPDQAPKGQGTHRANHKHSQPRDDDEPMNISSGSPIQKKIQNMQGGNNGQWDNSPPQGNVSPFESSSKPAIPAALYLQLLCCNLKMPEEHSVCALVLINRICTMSGLSYPRIYEKDKDTAAHTRGRLTINSLTVHRLILTSLLVTHKYFTDFCYFNSDISKAGGVSLQELN